jgi:hypothetical protein
MRQAVLLRESRAYGDGRRLTLRYAKRGRGLDVFLEAAGGLPTGDSAPGPLRPMP